MISVVMPVYNSEQFLAPAIQSILDQTYTTFEFIIVDDGSTDSTAEIIQKFAESDERIKIINGNHEGVGKAMNLGIDHAIYPWVAVMHADDIAMPQRLERQIAAAQSDPEVVIWGTGGYHINADNDVLSYFQVGPQSKKECRQLRADARMVQAIHPTVMLNREVLIKAGGYDSTLHVAEDVELFDRMLCYGDLVTIPENLMRYRIHGASLSMAKNAKMHELRLYVLARQKHRNQTGEELTYEAFKRQHDQRPTITKLLDYRERMANFYYRRAGMAYGEKQYLKTVYYLSFSLMLRPLYPIQRAWKQVLSPEAREKTRLVKA